MAKNILITSTDLMMVQFLIPHVENLVNNGYKVDIACSDVGGRIDEIKEKVKCYIDDFYVVKLKRNPFSLSNFKGLKQLKEIINHKKYDLIWTNEPVMGVMTRLAAKKARKLGTKVIYMVHGFHFFKGAPKINWMIYYPIEKHFAKKTDLIITINTEDYNLAQKFKCSNVEYVHGIGINTARLSRSTDTQNIRAELGLTDSDFLVLSIGELNKNKNQRIIVEALARIKDNNIHYIICGKGAEKENLQQLSVNLGIADNVHFLGYRKDVVDICNCCDLYVMPSLREGLPVSSLEAMFCGLPLVTSNIRGLNDIMKNGVSGFMCKPCDVDAFADAIIKIKNDPDLRIHMGLNNKETVKPYCISETKEEIINIFNNLV